MPVASPCGPPWRIATERRPRCALFLVKRRFRSKAGQRSSNLRGLELGLSALRLAWSAGQRFSRFKSPAERQRRSTNRPLPRNRRRPSRSGTYPCRRRPPRRRSHRRLEAHPRTGAAPRRDAPRIIWRRKWLFSREPRASSTRDARPARSRQLKSIDASFPEDCWRKSGRPRAFKPSVFWAATRKLSPNSLALRGLHRSRRLRSGPSKFAAVARGPARPVPP